MITFFFYIKVGDSMAKTIKGITIEIDGDTSSLQKSLKDVDKSSKGLANELKGIDRLLKFNPGNAELISQKMSLLGDSVESTSKRLDILRQAQSQVNEQFQKGDITGEQYRNFQRELVATEGKLNGLRGQMENLRNEEKNVANFTKQLNTLFNATGSNVGDFSDILGDRLSASIKNGTANSSQLENAINKIGKAALGTNVDLGKMKTALSSLDDGKSIKNVSKELNNLAQDAKSADDDASNLGETLSGLGSGLIAAGGLQGVLEASLTQADLEVMIDVTFDVPEESKGTIKDAIKTLETYGVDGETALEGVRRQWALNKDATDEVNAAVVTTAGVMSKMYSDLDFTELITEAGEISKALNITDQEALGLVDALLSVGFPPDQLDIISEYGSQLADAGYNAQEVANILATSSNIESWNIDNLLDKKMSL